MDFTERRMRGPFYLIVNGAREVSPPSNPGAPFRNRPAAGGSGPGKGLNAVSSRGPYSLPAGLGSRTVPSSRTTFRTRALMRAEPAWATAQRRSAGSSFTNALFLKEK